MKKLKIYARSYGIILMMSFMGLLFGIVSAVVAGAIAGWEDIKKYYAVQVEPEIDEIVDMMKEELKNVD